MPSFQQQQKNTYKTCKKIFLITSIHCCTHALGSPLQLHKHMPTTKAPTARCPHRPGSNPNSHPSPAWL